MMTKIPLILARSATFALFLCLSPLLIVQAKDQPQPKSNHETHLANVRQLTFGGKNAEAYFSFDGQKLIFQSTKDPKEQSLLPCYQIFTMDLDGTNIRRVSTGSGATTCGYYFPGERRVLYSSTHLSSPFCPPPLPKTKQYRWALDNYDIFSIHVSGRDLQRLTSAPGYDAEATISPDGKTIVFTSLRDGDLEIYTMKIDGTNIRRLTDTIGYDGGAFFSPDSRRIVYRANHPQTKEGIQAYQDLLAKNIVEPSNLEIFVMNADGSDQRQVTANGASNFAPYFLPDGRRIIFSTSFSPTPREKGRPDFHLYLVRDDGTELEQITFSGHFNSFPMFSPDGTKLVWVSDHNATAPREFNIFLADWVP
jgi:Tol biopolymer transport system component